MTQVKNYVISRLSRFEQLPALAQEDGQTLAEYALILALIAVLVVGVVALLGSNISSIFNSIATSI